MRRLVTLAGLAVLVLVAVTGLVAGSAAAAGQKKLVEGTVYDTTCATACTPECPPPPHCGPITQDHTTKVVCAQQAARLIVCPLADSHRAATPDFCIQGEPCGVDYPVYSGEGATVNVRKRGSATVLTTLPIAEGHFEIRLGPGEYVLHPRLPEEPCLVGVPATVKITARTRGPIPVSLNVGNTCIVHPDVK